MKTFTRITINLLIFILLFSMSSCTYMVTRKEADDMEVRIYKIVKILEKRRKDERQLAVSLEKAKKELVKVRYAREKYRKSQVQFIEKVRIKLKKLATDLSKLHSELETLNIQVQSKFQGDVTNLEKALQARTSELVQLENQLKSILVATSDLKANELEIIIKLLISAKQWKLVNGFLAILMQKYPTDSKIENVLFELTKALYKDVKYGKTLIYAGIYTRKYPSGQHFPDILEYSALAQYKYEKCSKALKLLKLLISKYPKYHRITKIKELFKKIKSELHSRQFCAQ